VTGARLLAVNIGSPEPQPGVKQLTGINKQPRTGPVLIDKMGLVGDAVLDRRHHGGPDQAVYIYFQSDYDWWGDELGETPPPGRFGENLTIAGVEGSAVALGDRFRIGQVLLEITLHRTPCATFSRHMGDPAWVRRFHRARRPGAYARVLAQGTVEAGEPVAYIPFAGQRVTVGELMNFDGEREVPAAFMGRVLETPVHHKLRSEFSARLAAL